MLWSPSLTVVVARQQYGRRHSLAQESRTRSSSLEHRSLITAFACRSLLSLEDESVLESDHTVVSECLESNNNKSYNSRRSRIKLRSRSTTWQLVVLVPRSTDTHVAKHMAISRNDLPLHTNEAKISSRPISNSHHSKPNSFTTFSLSRNSENSIRSWFDQKHKLRVHQA